tara:strand:- start:31 stop:513 length:483 start_codon:yes stop_codon:yes gene_type:complete
MALFTNKNFIEYNDYMTPYKTWEDIKQYIPKNKKIWECFFGDGNSGKHLEKLGFQVIHEKIDFFKNNKGDILVSNPPFSKKKEVFSRLKKLDKPFIMICPSSLINTMYFRNLFKNQIQIIIPRKRINFIKDGKIKTNRCNFDCFYYCYKINLKNGITWLD